jgi:hypothetical protein
MAKEKTKPVKPRSPKDRVIKEGEQRPKPKTVTKK